MLLAIAALAFVPAALTLQAPTWDQLKAVYDVSSFNTDSVKTQDRTAPEGTYTEFSFPSENGDTAYGTFVRPNAQGPFPLVILLHGLGGNRQFMIDSFAKDFLSKGVAVMALDAPHHGDRASPHDKELLNKAFMGFAMSKDPEGLGEYLQKANDPELTKFTTEAIEGGVRDIRRAMNWALFPGHRVDQKQVGTFGVSMGSIMASILTGVDDRVDADLLVIGGDPIEPFLSQAPTDQALTESAAACSLFLPHSTAHVLMLNGYNDQIIPRGDILRLYESAPGTTLVFYDTPGDVGHGFGHSIPAEGYSYGENWLAKMIGVPKPAQREHAVPVGGP